MLSKLMRCGSDRTSNSHDRFWPIANTDFFYSEQKLLIKRFSKLYKIRRHLRWQETRSSKANFPNTKYSVLRKRLHSVFVQLTPLVTLRFLKLLLPEWAVRVKLTKVNHIYCSNKNWFNIWLACQQDKRDLVNNDFAFCRGQGQSCVYNILFYSVQST